MAEAVKQLGSLHERVLRAQLKTIYSDAKTAAERYLAAGNDLVAVQTARFEQLAKRGQASEAWTKGFDGLLGSPALAGLPNRREIETHLFEASAAFNLARAASWRYASTVEAAQKDLALSGAGHAAEILKRAQKLPEAKAIAGGIEGLVAAAGAFKALTEEVIKSDDQRAKLTGAGGEGTHQRATRFNDLPCDDDRLDVCSARAHHERGDRIAEAVEMRRTHVDNRHIRLLAGGEAADLMVEVPRARRVECRQPEYVTLVQLNELDCLLAAYRAGVGP